MRRLLAISLLVLLSACRSGQKGAPANYPVWGIDISRHQGRVDWKKLATNRRPDFVFLKATEGLLIADPLYAANVRALEKEGILYGAYHFFGHRTPGKDQARNFIATAALKKGNLVPVLDIEWHRYMTDPQKSVREARAFCGEIRRAYGVLPIIYCSANFYDRYLKKDFPPSRYTLWIADYRGNPAHIRWHFWQHTCSHRLRGTKSKVDRNVFCGTREELQKHILK